MDKNKKNVKNWVCVEITHRYNKTQHVSTLKKFLKMMFKQQQILFLGNKLDQQNFANVMDGYFFIQCSDITPYIDTLKQSKYINNILINFDQISYISDKQISEMYGAFMQSNKNRQNEFYFGDVVKIKKGMFKNLYSIVLDSKSKNQLIVLFKFISGYRIQKITIDNCQLKNNFFDIVRCGVNEL